MLFQENCVRLQNKQALYAAWKQAVEENNTLNTLLNTLHAQIKDLRSEVANLKGENEQVHKPESETIKYYTDEEGLAKETELILQRKGKAKKRKMCPLSTPLTQSTQEQSSIEKTKPIKPPPIIIYQVRDYDTIFNYLNKKLVHNFKITLQNNGDLKLNVDSADHYRTASKILTEVQFKWSTYENKQARHIRVVVKKLLSTCKPEQIVQELRQKGYHILEAVNILKWKTKEPLPIFMLTDRTENIPKIYEISNIRGMRVEVTPYRKTGLLPQCKNCQRWGHTKSYCHKESRCAKCAGKHTTESCSKPKEIPPKCYNCGENHPANYRGCVVAKKLQALQKKAANPTKLLPPSGKQAPQTRKEHIPIPHEVGVTKTYADAAKTLPPHMQPKSTPDN
jgi:hypothetical protein